MILSPQRDRRLGSGRRGSTIRTLVIEGRRNRHDLCWGAFAC